MVPPIAKLLYQVLGGDGWLLGVERDAEVDGGFVEIGRVEQGR